MKKTITVETMVKGDPHTVWKAWTDPRAIEVWNQASADWHCPHAENDVRVGGTFLATMAAKDGSSSFDFTGTYTAVKEEELLSYVIADGRAVTVTFVPMGALVLVSETFELENTHSDEQQRSGWQAILESFKAYVEKQGAL